MYFRNEFISTPWGWILFGLNLSRWYFSLAGTWFRSKLAMWFLIKEKCDHTLRFSLLWDRQVASSEACDGCIQFATSVREQSAEGWKNLERAEAEPQAPVISRSSPMSCCLSPGQQGADLSKYLFRAGDISTATHPIPGQKTSLFAFTHDYQVWVQNLRFK